MAQAPPAPPALDSGDLPVTIDDDEASADAPDQTLVAPIVDDSSTAPSHESEEPGDVVIADDLAVMLDAEVDAEDIDVPEVKKANESAPPLPGKRSIPPPLPRA